MLFFTRELYNAMQPDSGSERQAWREWDRRVKIYSQYSDSVLQMLPKSLKRLHSQGLHDARIIDASFADHELSFTFDTSSALSGFRGRVVQLIFKDVRGRFAVSKLIGQWWLYEEFHLQSDKRFVLHVFFDKTEIEIDAKDLVIRFLPKRKSPK